MAFQFPANPTLGQQFAPTSGVTYEWNGTGWIFLGLNTASLYPAGIILPYAGAAPLPFQGWLICDGASYITSAQPALFAIIGYAYGGAGANFQVPDLRGRVVAGVDGGAGRLTFATLGAGLGAERVALSTGELAAHTHGITDVAHAHGVSDPTHAHAVYDPGHVHGNDAHGHGLNDPTHAHGVNDPSHTHGYVESSQNPPGNNFALQGPGPGQVWKDNSTSFPAFTGISIAASGTGQSVQASGINIHAAGTSIGIYGAGTGIGIAASGTGLSTTNAVGSGGAHLNVQPTIVLNYIIKT